MKFFGKKNIEGDITFIMILLSLALVISLVSIPNKRGVWMFLKKVNGLDLAGRWFVSSSLKEETENIDLIDAEEFVKYCCNIRMVKKEDINNPLSYSVVVGEGVAAFGPFYVIGCGKGLIYCFNNLFLHLNANSHHLRVLSPGTDTFCGQYTCYSINGNYYFGYNTMNRVGYVDNLEVPFFAISDEEYAYFTSFYIGKWDMTLTQYDENFQKGETSTLKFNFKKKKSVSRIPRKNCGL